MTAKYLLPTKDEFHLESEFDMKCLGDVMKKILKKFSI